MSFEIHAVADLRTIGAIQAWNITSAQTQNRQLGGQLSPDANASISVAHQKLDVLF